MKVNRINEKTFILYCKKVDSFFQKYHITLIINRIRKENMIIMNLLHYWYTHTHIFIHTVHVVNICITQTSYFSLFHCDQALLECFGSSGSTGPEAVVAAERTAAVLTAKAGARDPSAIPSICRISAALQSAAGKVLSWKWYLFACGISKCRSTYLPLDFSILLALVINTDQFMTCEITRYMVTL